MDCTIREGDLGNAFELSPPTLSISLALSSNLANSIPDGNRFDSFNFADDLKVFAHCEVMMLSVLFTPLGCDMFIDRGGRNRPAPFGGAE